MTISNSTYERIMKVRDDNLLTIKIWLPRLGPDEEKYQRELDEMYAQFSKMLHIPIERVRAIESTCVGHIDYASKFALRLAHEYFGVE
jgi:hypothetical protein